MGLPRRQRRQGLCPVTSTVTSGCRSSYTSTGWTIQNRRAPGWPACRLILPRSRSTRQHAHSRSLKEHDLGDSVGAFLAVKRQEGASFTEQCRCEVWEDHTNQRPTVSNKACPRLV